MSEEEVKAAQKAVVPHNSQKNTNWAVTMWKDWSQSRWSRISSVPFAHLYIIASSPVQLDHVSYSRPGDIHPTFYIGWRVWYLTLREGAET